MEDKIDDLKPCPFCGDSRASLEIAPVGFAYTNVFGEFREVPYHYFTVKCGNRTCGCGIGVYEDPEMAKSAWNRRAGDERMEDDER